MSTARPDDPDEPECVYFATPEELEAARELAKHHCRPEADAQDTDQTNTPED